jgi:sugar/nucleoside kinase (ribokinase family)
MAVRFVAVGELLVDVVAEGSGHDTRIRVHAAGSSFNAAAAAARAGAHATVIGTVGDDPAGRMILTELDALGIHAEVTVADGPTGTFLFVDGEVRVDRGVGHDLVVPERILADAVLVSGYVPAAADALAAAHAQWVALDSAQLAELPPGANVAIRSGGTEEDARRLAEGRRLAVVTLGAEGAIAVAGDRVERVVPPATARDAPGSGDVFAATLLVGLARGDDLARALGHAAQAAVDSLS